MAETDSPTEGKVRVKAPDGKILAFPSTMSREQIAAAMKQYVDGSGAQSSQRPADMPLDPAQVGKSQAPPPANAPSGAVSGPSSVPSSSPSPTGPPLPSEPFADPSAQAMPPDARQITPEAMEQLAPAPFTGPSPAPNPVSKYQQVKPVLVAAREADHFNAVEAEKKSLRDPRLMMESEEGRTALKQIASDAQMAQREAMQTDNPGPRSSPLVFLQYGNVEFQPGMTATDPRYNKLVQDFETLAPKIGQRKTQTTALERQERIDAGDWQKDPKNEINYQADVLDFQGRLLHGRALRVKEAIEQGADPRQLESSIKDIDAGWKYVQSRWDALARLDPKSFVDKVREKEQMQSDMDPDSKAMDFVKGTVYGAAGTLRSSYAGAARLVDVGDGFTFSDRLSDWADGISKDRSAGRATENKEAFLGKMADGAGSMVGFMVGGGMGKAGLVLPAVTSLTTEYESFTRQAIEQGADEQTAENGALLYAPIAAAIEFGNPQMFLSSKVQRTAMQKEFIRFLKDGMKPREAMRYALEGTEGAFKEGLEELGQTLSERATNYLVNEMAGTDLNATITAEEAKETFLVAAILGGAGAVANTAGTKKQRSRVQAEAMQWAAQNPEKAAEITGKYMAQDPEAPAFQERLDKLAKVYKGNNLMDKDPVVAAEVADLVEEKTAVEEDMKDAPADKVVAAAGGDPRMEKVAGLTKQILDRLELKDPDAEEASTETKKDEQAKPSTATAVGTVDTPVRSAAEKGSDGAGDGAATGRVRPSDTAPDAAATEASAGGGAADNVSSREAPPSAEADTRVPPAKGEPAGKTEWPRANYPKVEESEVEDVTDDLWVEQNIGKALEISDTQGEPSGWMSLNTPDGLALISRDGSKTKFFKNPDATSGSNLRRTRIVGAGWAVDNPYQGKADDSAERAQVVKNLDAAIEKARARVSGQGNHPPEAYSAIADMVEQRDAIAAGKPFTVTDVTKDIIGSKELAGMVTATNKNGEGEVIEKKKAEEKAAKEAAKKDSQRIFVVKPGATPEGGFKAPPTFKLEPSTKKKGDLVAKSGEWELVVYPYKDGKKFGWTLLRNGKGVVGQDGHSSSEAARKAAEKEAAERVAMPEEKEPEPTVKVTKAAIIPTRQGVKAVPILSKKRISDHIDQYEIETADVEAVSGSVPESASDLVIDGVINEYTVANNKPEILGDIRQDAYATGVRSSHDDIRYIEAKGKNGATVLSVLTGNADHVGRVGYLAFSTSIPSGTTFSKMEVFAALLDKKKQFDKLYDQHINNLKQPHASSVAGAAKRVDASLPKAKPTASTKAPEKKVPIPEKEVSEAKPYANLSEAERKEALDLEKELRALLGGQLNAGVDPRVVQVGGRLAFLVIKNGAKTFAAFAQEMVAKMGDAIKPHLKSLYSFARYAPGADVEGMTPDAEVSSADVDQITKPDDEPTTAEAGSGNDAPGVADGARPGDGAPDAPRGSSEALPGREGDGVQGEGPGVPEATVQPVRSGSGGRSGNRGTGTRRGKPKPGAASSEPAGGTEADSPVSEVVASRNYVLPRGEDWVPAGDKTKARANIAAIRLLKKIEEEAREATDEEKAVLSKYTGWGGLKPAVDREKNYAADRIERNPWHYGQDSDYRKTAENWKKDWKPIYDEIVELLTEEEFDLAVESTDYAHYTSRTVINAMWDAVLRLGYKGGEALEPASGVGHFIGLTPDSVRAKTSWQAIDKDSLSARITKVMYPDAKVKEAGYEEVKVGQSSKDLIITNVPFSDVGVYDKQYPDMNLHNYFIVRGLDQLRPGGLMAVITSSWTMDSLSPADRQMMEERADLVGAMRLPNDAFKKNAGTSVTADVLFFRKRDEAKFAGQPFLSLMPSKTHDGITSYVTGYSGTQAEWDKLAPEQQAALKKSKRNKVDVRYFEVNEYFAEHPDMVLGNLSLEGSMRGRDPEMTVEPKGEDLGTLLDAAVKRLPKEVMGEPLKVTAPQLAEAQEGEKIGRLLIQDGAPAVVNLEGKLEAPEWWDKSDKAKARLKQAKQYLSLRERLFTLLKAEGDPDTSAENLEELRGRLNSMYDAYVKDNGNLQDFRKSGFLTTDVDFPVVAALEYKAKGKDGKKTFVKMPILSAPTSRPVERPQSADNVRDGVDVSINWLGRIDIPYIASMTKTDPEQVKEQLRQTGDAYENPRTGAWETPEQYLSGMVREKLEEARTAAESNELFKQNVEALEKVQPEKVPVERIEIGIGARWVPEKVYEKFLKEILGVTAKVTYVKEVGKFDIQVDRSAGDYDNYHNMDTWGVRFSDEHGGELAKTGMDLFSNLVRLQSQTIGYRTPEPESRYVADLDATIVAQNKQLLLNNAFAKWVKGNPQAAATIEDVFNEKVNISVRPEQRIPKWPRYPGQVKQLMRDGKLQDFVMEDHQKRGVERSKHNSTLIAHGVGFGKTFTEATVAMEWKRLGISNKPAIAVMNLTMEQYVREVLTIYPDANLHFPEGDFANAVDRNIFMAQAAMGDWDIVIIPHSVLDLIPNDPKREEAWIRLQMMELAEAKRRVAQAKGSKPPGLSDINRAIKSLALRLKKLQDKKKDTALTFEQLGIDGLIIDESHEYKKLPFTASRGREVKGLDRGGNTKRGPSALLKFRYIQEKNRGRGTGMATGTPVSNSIAETWNKIRYLRPDLLQRFDVESFDEFDTMFLQAATEPERTATGGIKNITRLIEIKNVQKFQDMWLQMADVEMNADKAGIKRPPLKGGGPQAPLVPLPYELGEWTKHLAMTRKLWDAMGGKEKEEKKLQNIPMRITAVAKLGAVSMRYIDSKLPENPDDKLGTTVKAAKKVYDETNHFRGVQMIFTDLVTSLDGRINIYADIRDRLVQAGIPEHEILIARGLKKGAQREQAFMKLKSGEYRIAIGSTSSLGTGVNAQDRLAMEFHLDAPWRPMDMEQREGRLLRQGNRSFSEFGYMPGIDRTVVDRSYDGVIFSMLTSKAKMVQAVLDGSHTGDKADDLGGQVILSYQQAKAAASGDPRFLIQGQLENQLRTLHAQRSDFANTQRKAARDADSLERLIPLMEGHLLRDQRGADMIKKDIIDTDQVKAVVDGKTYTNRSDTVAALDAFFKSRMAKWPKDFAEADALGMKRGDGGRMAMWAPAGVMSLNGHKIALHHWVEFGTQTGADGRTQFGVINPDTSTFRWNFTEDGLERFEGNAKSGPGFFTSLRSVQDDIVDWPRRSGAQLDIKKKDLAEAESILNTPYTQDALIASKEKELEEIASSFGDSKDIDEYPAIAFPDLFLKADELKAMMAAEEEDEDEDGEEDAEEEGDEDPDDDPDAPKKPKGPSKPEGVDPNKPVSSKARKLAQKVRETGNNIADILEDPTTMKSAFIPPKLVRAGFEFIARSIEHGADIADSFSKAINYILDSDWYRGLSPDDQTRADSEMVNEFAILAGIKRYAELESKWIGKVDEAAHEANVTADNIQKRIQATVPKDRFGGSFNPNWKKAWQDVDAAIHVYLDLKANPEHLGLFYNELTPDQQRLVNMSQNLTPVQQEIADDIDKEYRALGKRAQEEGQIANVLDNYVARAWDFKGKPATDVQRFHTSTRHKMQRTLGTILEGWARGYTLKINGASNNLQTVKTEINQAIANKAMIAQGAKIKYGAMEVPLFSTFQAMGYERVNHPNFVKWSYAGKLEDYNASDPQMLSRDLLVTPEGTVIRRTPLYAPRPVAKNLNAILEKSVLADIKPAQWYSKWSNRAKSSLFLWSLFHHQAFMRSHLLQGKLKWGQINPFTAYRIGLKMIAAQSPEVTALVEAGMTIGKMQDWQEAEEVGIEKIRKLLDRKGIAGDAARWIESLWTAQNRWLFDKYGAGLKALDGVNELRAELQRNNKLPPEKQQTVRQVAETVARTINQNYGGLNLKRTKSVFTGHVRSATEQQLWRWTLLAPDWTESNLQMAADAFKGGYGGDFSRRMWARVLLRSAGAWLVLNLLTALVPDPDDGEDPGLTTLERMKKRFNKAWEEGHLRYLMWDVTPLYHALGRQMGEGKYDPGRRIHYSIMGHFSDPLKVLGHEHGEVDPFKGFITFAKGKLNPFAPRPLLDLALGEDWKGDRFTTLDELVGLDDKGVYTRDIAGHQKGDINFNTLEPYKRDQAQHFAGEEKGGKLAGRLTAPNFERDGHVTGMEAPSWAMNSIRGVMPTWAQNAEEMAAGEKDALYSLLNMLGLGVHSSRERGQRPASE